MSPAFRFNVALLLGVCGASASASTIPVSLKFDFNKASPQTNTQSGWTAVNGTGATFTTANGFGWVVETGVSSIPQNAIERIPPGDTLADMLYDAHYRTSGGSPQTGQFKITLPNSPLPLGNYHVTMYFRDTSAGPSSYKFSVYAESQTDPSATIETDRNVTLTKDFFVEVNDGALNLYFVMKNTNSGYLVNGIEVDQYLPLPGSLALLGMGLVGAGLSRRRFSQ